MWAHNSHIGNAEFTEMGQVRGEHNIGQLARDRFGEDAALIGFGTDRGTVAAASDWDGPMEIKRVRPARDDSYEGRSREANIPAFFLETGPGQKEHIRAELAEPLLERAIGVIYRPETELLSHYFQAELSRQFDAWIWFTETEAVAAQACGPSARSRRDLSLRTLGPRSLLHSHHCRFVRVRACPFVLRAKLWENGRKAMGTRWLTMLLVAGLAAGGGYYYWQQRSAAKLDVQTVAATRGDVRRVVSTSGTVRALGTVEIGSQLSGNIGELNADFSSEVKQGQVLARIEPSTFETRVREEEAGVAIAKANVALQEASVERAEVQSA